MLIMKKTNNCAVCEYRAGGAYEVLAVFAAVMSVISLVIGIIALIRTFGRDRMNDSEYSIYRDHYDIGGNISDDDEDIGSDTLAF